MVKKVGSEFTELAYLVLVDCLLMLLVAASTFSRTKSGTIILVFYSSDKVVMVADSRVELHGKADAVFRDDGCKLFELDKKLIAGITGVTGREFSPGEIGEPWDIVEYVKRDAESIVKTSADDVAEAMARRWGQTLRTLLDKEFADPTSPIVDLNSHLLSSATFAGVSLSGDLSVYTVTATCCAAVKGKKRALVDINLQQPTSDGYPVGALGIAAGFSILNELIENKTARAQAESREWNKKVPSISARDMDARLTAHFADAIIRFSGDKCVGGPIDIVELDRNGYRWVERKTACQESR
jgi:hypothetical protein